MGLQKLTTNLADALGQHIIFFLQELCAAHAAARQYARCQNARCRSHLCDWHAACWQLALGGPSLSAKNPRDFRVKDGPRLMKSLQKMVIISAHRLPEGASDIFFCCQPKIRGSQVDRHGPYWKWGPSSTSNLLKKTHGPHMAQTPAYELSAEDIKPCKKIKVPPS